MDRIVIFTNMEASFSEALLRSFLRELRERKDICAAAVVETGSVTVRRLLRLRLAHAASSLFNPRPHIRKPVGRGTLKSICRQHKVPLIVSGPGDFRSASFRTFIKEKLRANMALSLGCFRIFPAEMLGLFDVAVNYHNGQLPAYRGLRATSWAVYRDEPCVGFSFHHMDELVDAGNVLLTDSIPAAPGQSTVELEDRKTARAASCCAAVIEMIKERDKGTQQTGAANYFGRRELLAVRNAGATPLSSGELLKRLRCFEFVWLDINGRTLPVSAGRGEEGNSPFHFTAADGTRFRATRFFHLPYAVYRIVFRWMSPHALAKLAGTANVNSADQVGDRP